MKSFQRLLMTGLLCITAVVVTVVVVRAQSADGTGVKAKKKSGDIPLADRFRELDKNNDSKLTREELGPGLFEFLNANGDESVTLEEAREVIRDKGSEALRKAAQRTSAPTAAALPAKDDMKQEVSPKQDSLRVGPQRLTAGEHGIGRRLPDLQFTDINRRAFSLSDLADRRVVVIAFTNTSCPLCKKYAPTLAAIEKQFRDQQVTFVFVNPTASEQPEAIRAAIQSHGLAGSYVQDTDGAIARALGATHTTDVFVVDAKRTLVYRGAVDDQYGFGYAKEIPQTEYLIAAIEAVLANGRPDVAATSAPGCPLELAPADKSTATTGITYHNRIARILQNNCQACHREGGVAPFTLGSYEEVAAQSGSIRRAVEQGIMPPWFAAAPAKGQVSPFANDCSLAETDKTDLLTWLNGGKPVGDPQEAPVPRVFASDWQIGQPDHIVQLPSPLAVRASGTMPYQNVIVETGLTGDKYVKAIEVRPTARDVVHHVLVFVIPPAKRGETNGATTEGDGEEDETTGFFAAYAPGYDALRFNDGCGKMLPAGSRLKFQIHYTPNGTATQDQSMIGLIFLDERPEHLMNVTGIAQPRLAIPPGANNHEVIATRNVPNDATIVAFFPHMHLRGKAFRYEAVLPNGQTQVLLDIPRYDFNWQLSYRLAEPITLPGGSTIRATAWYDNSTQNPANPDATRTVRWGPQTYDEMMIGYVEYYMDDGVIGRSGRLLGPASGFDFEAFFKRLDKNNDDRLTNDELPRVGRDRLLQLDANGDGDISREEIRRLKR